MIKAVFFDFYNTLARFWPPVQLLQRLACREVGLSVTEEGITLGYAAADDFFSRENSAAPLHRRSEAERLAFFTRYEQIILTGAGLSVSPSLARQVWLVTASVPKGYVCFPDVVPLLRRLKQRGLIIGVLSNLNDDLSALVANVGLAPYVDRCVASRDVGVEKPHPRIFQAALEGAGVAAAEAVHVGDQYHSDVRGARAAGIRPVLLDRGGHYPSVRDCARVTGLAPVEGLVAGWSGPSG